MRISPEQLVWLQKLAEWSAVNQQRDAIIRSAYAAGVPKNQIYVMTGVARSTIDRILAGGVPPESTQGDERPAAGVAG